jgi:DNA-binding transcriptional MerR regulator/effector-binding domain-containing protein
MYDSKDFLSIGEVSKICRITVKTLRYYDKIGLFKPAYIDSANQYRYYSKSQLPFIIYVKELRLLGFSLADIEWCSVKKENMIKLDKVASLISEKTAQTAKQIEKLQKIQQQFASWEETHMGLEQPETIESGNIAVKHIPSRFVAFYRFHSNIESYSLNVKVTELVHVIHENNLYHKGTVMAVFYDDYRTFNPANADIEVCMEILDAKPDNYSFIKEIPAGLYISVIYNKDYRSVISDDYPVLYNWIAKHNYQVIGSAIQLYRVSVPLAQSPSSFITEVQVPVKNNK